MLDWNKLPADYELSLMWTIGSLRNNDGDSYAYSISFDSSNVGILFCSWILKDCIKGQENKKKVVLPCVHFVDRKREGTFTL